MFLSRDIGLFLFAYYLVVKSILAEDTAEDDAVLERHKRQLLFPVATLLQISACVASPIILPDFLFFMNHGFQLNFGLPNRLSQLPNSFLPAVPIIEVARSARDKRDATPDPEPQQQQHREITSDVLYYILSQLIDTFGYNGTGCLLRSICELGRVPFHKDEDLMHEVVHFIMTPSEHDVFANFTTEDAEDAKYKSQIRVPPFEVYLRAEDLGKSQGDCLSEYGAFCPQSPLDFLSEIVHEDEVDDDDREEQEANIRGNQETEEPLIELPAPHWIDIVQMSLDKKNLV